MATFAESGVSERIESWIMMIREMPYAAKPHRASLLSSLSHHYHLPIDLHIEEPIE
ncbi:MAG: hypothetical protein PVSMB2_24030 [Ktedonobacteraceae bacterium]